MATDGAKPIEIFYSYASTEDETDEKLQQQLEKHLGVLKRQGKIAHWHKRNILAGQISSEEVSKHLNSAQIILLLISPDFVSSDDCWDIEMERALERQKEEKTLVIPVLMRPIDYKEAPFSNLRVLPKNGKPITSWDNQDEAFADIAYNIRLLAEKFEKTQKISWKDLGVGVTMAIAISTLVTGSTSNTQQSSIPLKSAKDWQSTGRVFYQANGSTGWQGWFFSPGCKVISDGSLVLPAHSKDRSLATAPYSANGLPDFVIETEMRFLEEGRGDAGIMVYGSRKHDLWQGNMAGISSGSVTESWSPGDGERKAGHVKTRVILGTQMIVGTHKAPGIWFEDFRDYAPYGVFDFYFDPGKSWHVLQLVIRGNEIELRIDGTIRGYMSDHRERQYLYPGGQMGLWCRYVSIAVKSFRVLAW